MSSDAAHPGTERLLLYADGHLDVAAGQSISSHLAECERCREWLADLDTGVAEYKRFWRPILSETAAPPGEWCDLRERMEAQDAIGVLRQRMRPAPFLQWAAIAAALLVLAVGTRWFLGRPVRAGALLRQAAARESVANAPRSPIRLMTPSGTIVRPAVWRRDTRPMAGGAERVAAIRALFESANFSWDDPLSARSFSAWRESLADRQDQVRKVRAGDGTSSYEIRTRTASGRIAEARLALRASDLHAIWETLQFRSNERIEIAEDAAAELIPAPAPAPVEAGPRPPEALSVPLEVPITPGEELRVWAALRRIDADLGDPVVVERDAERRAIVVTALGMPPDRRRALEHALNGLPRVELRFREPQPVRQPEQNLTAGGGAPPPLEPQLEAQLGSRNSAEQFINRVLQASETSLLRAYALRELATRFPPEIEAQLSATDQALLASLVGEHVAALEAATQAVLSDARQLAPPAGPVPAVPVRAWQMQAASVAVAVESVDRLLTKLLAVPGGAVHLEALTTQLKERLARMEAEVAAVRR